MVAGAEVVISGSRVVVVNSSGIAVVGSEGGSTVAPGVEGTVRAVDFKGSSVGASVSVVGNSVVGSSAAELVVSIGNALVVGSGSGAGGAGLGLAVVIVTGGIVVDGLGLTHRPALSTVTQSNNFRHIKSQEQTV